MSGEYVVLDGARALALPTKAGQYMSVLRHPELNFYYWRSLDAQGHAWFEAKIDLQLTQIISTTDQSVAVLLLKLLQYIARERQDLFFQALQFTTQLEFDRHWGLGSSSTFINNLAQWSGVNAFDLLQISLGGSGYDLAVAQAQKPVIYHLDDGKPKWNSLNLSWNFTDKLWFVYLNRKQNSREGIRRYRKHKVADLMIKRLTGITQDMIKSQSLAAFENLIDTHETLISNIIHQKPVKALLFSDYSGSIKSLGAWGGDFVLATGNDTPEYFKSKNYNTVINYRDFIAD